MHKIRRILIQRALGVHTTKRYCKNCDAVIPADEYSLERCRYFRFEDELEEENGNLLRFFECQVAEQDYLECFTKKSEKT